MNTNIPENSLNNQTHNINPKPKLLVVDDSRLVRVSIKKLLSNEFDILEAGDGEQGWEVILQNQDLKAVLTDAGMPKLDGFGLIERVRGHSDNVVSKLPMIMITGAEEGQTEIRQRALDLGASDFIIKPFDKAEMVARMRSYVKQDDLRRELKSTEQTLETHTTINPLSKLNNLKYFLQRASQELALAKRHAAELSIIAIHIDQVEQLRNKYGDKTLEKIVLWSVQILTPLLRKEDNLTHTNPYEFMIIAPATNRLAAAMLCERIQKQVFQTKYSESVLTIPVTVSMSLVSNASDRLESAENCLQLLRSRLQTALSSGGNRLVASDTPATNPVVTAKPAVFDVHKSLASLGALANHRGDIDLEYLANKLLPLIEHINAELHLDVKDQINILRKKLLDRAS